MFIIRIQTVLLLLFIGSQRLLAGTIPSGTETEDPLKTKHDVPHTFDNEKKDEHQNLPWDCQAESDYIQKEIALTTKILADGERFMENQDFSDDAETVLVLGKAGSGKTSLIQFLSGNPHLRSTLVRSDTGEYIIEDGQKIGTSATESFTLYPERVHYNSSITFCDSPGFHDSRSSAHEIVSMDVMKSTTSKFKRMKIVLLENYSSLQYGLFKDNFINTLRHLNDFLVDFDKYKDHIVLIATKVPFGYRMPDDISAPPEFITEDMHVESIIAYLHQMEKSLTRKILETNSRTDKEFYKKVIRLLGSLQTRDENGKVARINVFRRPYTSGPLEKQSLLEKNRRSLARTIMNLDFVEVGENDFDFTLSDRAKMYLECLLKLTSDSYKLKINELSFKLSEYVKHKTENYETFERVLTDLELLYGALKQLSDQLDKTKDYNEFFQKINSFISDQQMQPQIDFNEGINVIEKYERMLLKFVDTNNVFISTSWALPIRQVMRMTEEKLQWYSTLDEFITVLSSYEYQKKKPEIASRIMNEGSISKDDLMSLFMEATGSINAKHFFDEGSSSKKYSEIETVVKTFLEKNRIHCDANGVLRVEGFYVMLSEINVYIETVNSMVQKYDNIKVKEVRVLAVHTVFVDDDTNAYFKGVDMFVAANKWRVIGQRKIVLSGQPGPEISVDKYQGRDGRPGLPGGNGGSFIGIGRDFLYGGSLLVQSYGGAGGPGTDGAKGARGMDGSFVHDTFIPVSGEYVKSSSQIFGIDADYFSKGMTRLTGKHKFSLAFFDSSNSLLDTRADIKVVKEEGFCGENGGPGGLGGQGGIGGFAGDLKLLEFGAQSGIRLENQNGSMGTPGKQGETGEKGEDEMGVVVSKFGSGEILEESLTGNVSQPESHLQPAKLVQNLVKMLNNTQQKA
ncbi:uncharacterized protein LOC111049431 [Nilaparvata lugens]|uniref:uncharacterized protein LOC111049431 n=1 Tax=Nilaparvata lugens TaxID=108931 RepID=UPI00193EA5B0|nr:uncharacterized protein LOC111049431 [Nilaparvata lugens]XP_022191194.2 uncharacterized protein LOC111049431 [Nilaparvata lugens]